jgi:hypothetical protein
MKFHFRVWRFEGAEEIASDLEDDEATSGALLTSRSQTSLIVFEFHGLDNRELGIRIREIMK